MKKTLVILFVAGVLAACKSTDSNKSDYQYKDVPFTNVHFSILPPYLSKLICQYRLKERQIHYELHQ